MQTEGEDSVSSRGLGTLGLRRRLAFVFIPALLAAGFFFLMMHRWEQERLRARFRQHAAVAVGAVRDVLDDSLQALASLSSFYASSVEVGPGEFSTFVGGLQGAHPAGVSLGWVPRVAASAKGELEAAARAMPGLATFRVWTPGDTVAAAAPWPVCCPILHLQPSRTEDARPVGLDLAADSQCREAMARATDCGDSIATGPVRLVPGSGEKRVVLIFRPVFRRGWAHGTAMERRESVMGFVISLVQVQELVEGALKGPSVDGIEVLLRDAAAGGSNLLFARHGLGERRRPTRDQASGDNGGRGLVWATTFLMAGRPWQMELRPTGAYLTATADWSRFWVLLAGVVCTGILALSLVLEAGRALRLEGLTRDLSRAVEELGREIRERRRVEAELRTSENRYRVLVENLSQRVFYKDAEFLFVASNASFARSLGVTPGEVIGKTDYDFFPRELADKYRADDLRVLREGKVLDVEEAHLEQGKQRWVHTVKTPVRDPDGRVAGILGIFWDVTDERLNQEVQRRTASQLQEAKRLESLMTLAGGIAHDFNNLLHAIIGNTEFALSDLPAGAAARRDVDEIRKAALRAAELTKQMLDYTGKGLFRLQPLDLPSIAQRVVKVLEQVVPDGVQVEASVDSELPQVRGDEAQIEQAITNVATNAVEAVGERQGVIRVRTGVMDVPSARLAEFHLGELATPGTYAYVEISDTGCGMDEKTQARMFDPFFTTKFLGRGLGLAAAQGIMRGHRGLISVSSGLQQGTTVRLLLPQAGDGREAAPAPARPAPPEGRSGTGAAILVVEDEPGVRLIVTRFLEAAGYNVVAAGDGDEGLSLFREQADRLALVILDLTMPRMDGCEALREIRRIKSGARVIVSSGYAEEDVVRRFVGNEMPDAFLQKPYTRGAFLEKVRDILARG